MTENPLSITERNLIKTKKAVSIAIVAGVMIIDQLIKFAVKTKLSLYERIQVTDWFEIRFTENEGMAFGMDFIGTMFLAAFRVAAIIFFVYILHNIIIKKAPMGFIVCFAMIIAGAAGNIIDNSLYGLIFTESNYAMPPAQLVPFGEGYGSFLTGRVVDMFYFPLFEWPSWVPLVGGDVFFGAVFNFADASISCGAVALLIFYHKMLNADFLLKHASRPKM